MPDEVAVISRGYDIRQILKKRRDPNLNTRNMLVIAEPGEGGNLLLKRDIAGVLENTGDDVVIIDTFNGFPKKSFNADHVFLGDRYNMYINPFDRFHPFDECYREVTDSVRCLLFEMAVTMGLISTPREKSAMDAHIKNAISLAHRANNRSIVELIAGLLSTRDEAVTKLAVNLDKLDFLNDETTVDLSARCIVLHLEYGELNSGALLPVLSYLLSALYQKYNNTGKQTYVYIPNIDEFSPESMSSIASFWKRARKYAIHYAASTNKAFSDTKATLCSCSGTILLTNPFRNDDWLERLDIDKVEKDATLAYVVGNEIGTL